MVNPLWEEPGPAGETCRACIWRKPGKRADVCLRHRRAAVSHLWPACAAFTTEVDCLACGACCREAYHAVEVGPRDPFRRLHPQGTVWEDGRWVVPRTPRNWCQNLCDDYTCTVYADRPKTCRDFERGGINCVEARRRVGLTR